MDDVRKERTFLDDWRSAIGHSAARTLPASRLTRALGQLVEPQFQLKLAGSACKVVWKRRDVIGIKFV
jgi:hypothetical protein